MPFLLDAETAEKGGGVALGVPAFELGEFFLQFGGTDAVGFGEVLLGVKGIFFFHNVPQHGVALQHGVQHGAVVEFEVVLLQHAHALAGALAHRAGGGCQLAAEDAHQCGLARTVGADYAVAVAGSELEVHILEERLFAELYCQIADCDHSLSYVPLEGV